MRTPAHSRQWLSGALVIGLILIFVGGGIFIYLADEIGEQGWLTSLDGHLAESLHQYGPVWLVDCARAITFFGNASTLAVIGLLVALALALRHRWSLFLGWMAALFGAGVLNIYLKYVFQRVRPQLPGAWVTAPGWSFPSGHAMSSFVAYGFLIYLVVHLFPPAFLRRIFVLIFICLIILIGISRIYLGAHYLSDVVAGYAAAAVWLSFCMLATEQTQRRKKG
jgi:membrane-associated phospholipid phosphatase